MLRASRLLALDQGGNPGLAQSCQGFHSAGCMVRKPWKLGMKRAALELRVMIEVEVVKPGTFPLGFPTGIFQWTPPLLATVQTCYSGILWVQHLLKSFTYFGPLHPGEWQVLCRCAEGWIHAPNIATRRSNETDLHLLLILHWHWWAQGLLSWLHKGRRRGEVAQMDFFSIPFLTSNGFLILFLTLPSSLMYPAISQQFDAKDASQSPAGS